MPRFAQTFAIAGLSALSWPALAAAHPENRPLRAHPSSPRFLTDCIQGASHAHL
jgi:hypothetical protein